MEKLPFGNALGAEATQRPRSGEGKGATGDEGAGACGQAPLRLAVEVALASLDVPQAETADK